MKDNMQTFSRYIVEMRVNELKEATLDTDRLAVGKLMESLGDKPFKEATKDDMLKFFAAVTPRYKPSYVHLIKRRIKHFYAWLFNLERGQYPACVRWLRSYNPKKATKVKGVETTISPQNVLHDDDVLELIKACDHPRDAAVVSLLYETAAEANEVLALKVGSIMFDRYGAKVSLEGTGGTRILRIVDSIPYVQTWLNHHPSKASKEAPLWIVRGQKLKAMSYSNLYKILERLKDTTGIGKPVNPRALRHACITKMAKVLPEQLLKKFAGWTPNSPMAGIYVHLAGRDLDNALLEAHDREPQEPIKLAHSILTPKECPRCGHEIAPSWTYCPNCSLSFIRGTAASWDTLVQKLSVDPEAIQMLVEKYGLDTKLAEKSTVENIKQDFNKRNRGKRK